MGTSRQERLLREAIREHSRHLVGDSLLREAAHLLIEDGVKALTVGDFKKALAAAQADAKAKNLKAAVDPTKLAINIGKLIGGVIPIVGTIAGAIGAAKDLKDLYTKLNTSAAPKEKESHPLWDKLTIDPEAAAIVDAGVEQKFIVDLSNAVAGLPDSAPLPDADGQLTDWLKTKYAGRHVARPESGQ